MPPQSTDDWEVVDEWEVVEEPTTIPPTTPSPAKSTIPPSKGKFVTKGLTTQWQPETPFDISKRPDTSMIGGIPEFFDKARENMTTKIATNPYLPEWTKSPLAMMGSTTLEGPRLISEALSQPEGILGGWLGGIRNRVSSIGNRILGKADDIVPPKIDFQATPPKTEGQITFATKAEADLAAPGPSISPQFNPRGQTGMTGTAQTGPLPGAKITLKEPPTKEQIAELTSKGYVFDGLNDQGKFRFRKGPKAAEAPILETKPISKNAEPIIRRIKDKTPEQSGAIREAWNLSRGLMAVDLPFITSAGLRQGLPLIGTKNWLKAWGPSIRSYGSKVFYDSHKAMLEADPLMFRKVVPIMKADGTQLIKNGQKVFKETPSIAEQAGLSLTDLNSLTAREESIRSHLAERIPIWGRVVAASNRSYTAYINDLRLNAFRNMYEAMPDKNNLVALRELGDAINTFTGRGPLKTKIPFSGGKEVNLEKYASGLSEVLFAPKLMASRMQMLNPVNYTMLQPQVRKQYLIAAIRTAGAWTTFASLGKLVGAEVTLNPTSADFGKIKIGDTRLDPAGGFQQFLVLASRLATNEFTSSTTSNTLELGQGFGAPSRGSVTQDFLANKLHPSLRYFYDAAFARETRPFGVFDRALQLAVPMLSRDLMEIAQEQPELIPLLAPLTSAGMGTQHYTGTDFNAPMILPEESDITLGR